MRRYAPLPSVTVDFDFSMRAGLDASTVTPGSTAPVSSLTTPVNTLCPNTVPGIRPTTASARSMTPHMPVLCLTPVLPRFIPVNLLENDDSTDFFTKWELHAVHSSA